MKKTFQTKAFFLFIICAISLQGFAQEQEQKPEKDSGQTTRFVEPLRDEDIEKIRNLPSIGVGKGISFTSKDSLYNLNIRFRMQNTLSFTFDDAFTLTKTEAMVKRLRLRFEGFMFSPKLAYYFQLGFSGYDNEGLPGGRANIVRDAMIYYLPNKHWSIGLGQTKIQANRARVNSSSALQFVDRSIVNSVFQIDRDFGLFGAYNTELFDDFNIVVKASLTSGEGRNWKVSPNGGFAYTGRLELFPLGRFKNKGDVIEGDFEREPTPKFMVAGTYSTNQKAIRVEGQRGEEMYEGQTRNINSVFVDLIFKYRGFAFYTDYMSRASENPIIYNLADDTPSLENAQMVYNGQGVNVQGSYIFKHNYELAARYSQINPQDLVQEKLGYTLHRQYTVAVTKYIIGHSLKAQIDASYDQKRIWGTSSNKNNWIFRAQIELGI